MLNQNEENFLLEQVVSKAIKEWKEREEVQELTLTRAKRISELVIEKATSLSLQIVVAIHNKGARPVIVQCMDDAYIASYDIAMNKAYTSASLKMSTSKLKQLSMPGQSLYGIQHTNEGKIVIFGGGEPLCCKEKVMGSIGVSGGTEEQDAMLAQYGKNMFEEGM